MREATSRPAFYAVRAGGWRDWWTLLHPPYTIWHVAYVLIGASVAPSTDLARLLASALAFFLAVGVAAHALDELHGRPLRTSIPSPALVASAVLGLAGAVALGLVGVAQVSAGLLPFIGVGVFLVLAYDLELLGGRVHTDVGFAAAWGSFPVLTGAFAQEGRLNVPAVLAAGGAFALSYAQRSLSAPARLLRRRTRSAETTLILTDGTMRTLRGHDLLRPLERALRALSWGIVALALALTLARLGP